MRDDESRKTKCGVTSSLEIERDYATVTEGKRNLSLFVDMLDQPLHMFTMLTIIASRITADYTG